MICIYDNAISIKYVNKKNQRRLWDTQKSIEAEEKWALKKEEQEKRIKKNKFTQWIKLQKLNPLVYGYL